MFCIIACITPGVKAQVTCNFTYLDTITACPPFVLTAIKADNSPVPITQRLWQLTTSGGAPVSSSTPGSNDTSFTYIITTPGTYCLRLTSTNANGQTCTTQKCDIVAYASPTGNFTFSVTEGCSPLATQIQCNYQANCGNPGQITVDWGGGGAPYTNVGCPAGGIINKVYTANPGYYSPKFILTNSCGCTNTIEYDSLVRIIPKPVANFTADVTTANCSSSPLTVNFTANDAGPNMTYSWYVGTSTLSLVPSNGNLMTYSFPLSAQCYTVKLVVRHQSGGACADSLVRSQYICNRAQPNINFFQNITTACVDAQTPATLVLRNDPADGLTNLTWTLSGPQSFPVKVDSVASYSINTPGTYTVTAVGSFGAGCTDTIVQQVLVASLKPQANFTVSDTFGCATPHNVVYTATPTSCVNCVYSWSAVSATPSTSQNAVFSPVYNNFISCVPVTLRITSANGCADTLVKNNAVCVRRLAPRIGMDKVKGCAPLCVGFTNNTVLTNIPDPIASSCWSFPGSGLPGVCQATTSACFNTPGCYDVKLIVSTTTGCIDSVSLLDTICVGDPPTCTMTAGPLNYCFEADTTCFSISCNSSFDYIRCDYGDGIIESISSNAWCHYYQDTGLFNSKCIVFSDSCAGDTFDFAINIFPPIAAFSTTSGCSGGNNDISLVNNSEGATSYFWNFCDGTTSTLVSPTLSLQPCTTCDVTLTATNPNGCSHQKTQTITAPCGTVSMGLSDTSICVGGSIQFTNTSTSFVPGTTLWDLNTFPTINFGNSNLGDVITRQYIALGVFQVAMRNVSPTGCIDTIYRNVNVCGVAPDFGPTSVCLPLPICFQNQTVDAYCAGHEYSWDFGDGTALDTARNPCHTFASPGTYQVKLRVTNEAGCVGQITKSVIAATPVNLDYTVDTLLCPGSTSCVDNNSVGAPGVPLTYSWSMPNSNIGTSTSPEPCFSYAAPGDYPVYLQIASGSQCVVYDTFTVRNRFPVASGYLSADTLPCPQPPTAIQFTSTSQYYDSTLIWSFGNTQNTTSTFPNATFFYNEAGIYTVSLTVRTKDGCVNTTIVDTVVVKGPYGTFTASPNGMCSCKDTITLSISTVDATSLTMLYGCNFTGPTTSISPVGTISNPTVLNYPFNYCVADTCKPQLIFGDNAGCQVYIEQAPIPIDSPEVKFGFDNYGVCVNGTVCFEDTTIYHLPSNLSYTIKRVWDFGDGSPLDTSNNPTPCHYYAAVGGYTTKLFIWSNLGCFDSIVNTVVVIPEFPIAGFYADDSLVCATVPMCFHDTSYIYPLTGPDYWVWYWGDGQVDTSNTPDFCHAYDSGGYYNVTMCVYDSVGCPDCDSSIVIRVIDNPVASAGPDLNVCYGIPTQLNGSGGTAVHWEPAGIFVNPDVYSPLIPQLFTDTSVIIMVGDTFGCVDADTARLTISRVFADFTVGPNFCRDDSVCITDISTNTNGVTVNWFYDFGAGDTVNAGANPCYIYPEFSSGTYTIRQLAVNNNGCIDTSSHTINILPSPTALFSLNDTIICSDLPLCVTDLTTSQAPLVLWTWDYGVGSTVSGQSPPCRAYTPPYQATYPVRLYVEDQNGCSDTSVIVVTVNEIPQANFTWTTSCETDSMPVASTSVQGDGVIMGCEWLFWQGAPNPVIDNNCNTKFQFSAGNYPVQLVVTDINGCSDTIVRVVLSDSISQLSVTPGDTAVCLGTSVEYTVSGVFDNVLWQPETWLSSTSSPTVIVTPQANITYVISATNGVCASAKDTFTIRTIQPLPLDVTASPSTFLLGESVNLNADYPSNTSIVIIDSIVWSPDITLDCNNCPNPIATPTGTTTYTAILYYSDMSAQCITSDTVTVVLLNSCGDSKIFVPNTFTPNGDGFNEVFMIRSEVATKINYFRIFDRWGQLIFDIENGEANEMRWGWDGTNRNGEKLNSAVFVYTYEIECINGDVVNGKGNVTLVR